MPYKKLMGIYKIVNLETGKVYIGSSINLFSRKAEHFRKLKEGKHKNAKLQNSFNKYGKSSFIFEVIERVENADDLLKREQYFIDLYDASRKGYNILEKAGNSLGYCHTEEVRKSISARQKGENNYFWGKHLSKEHKEHISAGNKGKKHSTEAINKTREGHFKPIRNIETQRTYPYISLAAKELKVSVSALSNALRGKAQTCCGFHWEYVIEEKQNELS